MRKLYFLFLFALMSTMTIGQTIQTFNASNTFTVPAGVTSLTVYIYGAGGGGGGGTNVADFANGGGGGGGACTVNTITVSPSQVYTVTVGAGGTAGTPTANGGTGGTSIFSGIAGTFNASGGAGGVFSNGAAAATFAGGAGGSTGTGTIFSGGNGSAGNDASPGITGSGGGGAGSASNGGAGPATCTGSGGAGGTGVYPGGAGGYNLGCNTNSNTAGTAGAQPGGGGSGDNSFSSNLNGGAGGAGRIIIIYTPACITPSAPTSLNLTPSYTTVTGTFTAPAAPPTNYLVIRTTSAAAPSTPVTGTTYTPGTTALGGTIVSTNTTTGFTDNGLGYGTAYWYWIYSYNAACATTNPVYASTSLNGNTTTTACVTATNTMAITASGTYAWNTVTNWSLGHAPLPCENAVITGSAAINGTATVNLGSNVTTNSLTITLTGGGNAGNADLLVLNTNAFALALTNDIVITNNSTGNGAHEIDFNTSLNGSATCNNLTATITGTAGSNSNFIKLNTLGTLQVNGATLAKSPATGGTGGEVQINIGDLPASATFAGNAVFDDGTTSSVSDIYIGTTAATGNTTGKMIFKGNATFGAKAFSTLGHIHGFTIFDGASAQTLTVNNANTMYFPSVLVGSTNSPVVTLAGTGNPKLNATAPAPLSLSVNNNSVLDLGTNTFNVSALATADLSIASGARLKAGAATGGITGSNFPSNFSTYTLATGSTTEYYGATQTVANAPAYGNLEITTAGTKTAGGGLTITGNLTINSGATFAGSTFTHDLGGNWNDAGDFTQATSKIRFNGAGAQTITSVGNEVFSGLVVNKASSSLTILNSITVNAILNLSSGSLVTSTGTTLTLGIAGTTNNASATSYVNGTLLKAVASGTVPTFTFPIGTTSGYAPVQITGTTAATSSGYFGSAGIAGDLTSPAGSGFNYTKSVNRYWVLASNLSGVSSWSATFTYPSADVDPTATPANFVSKYTNGTIWSGTTVSGTPTSTTTSITGIASLSATGFSFAIAELLTYNITSSAGSHGNISPNGSTTVNYGSSQTYTITPSACYSISQVLVDGVNNAAAVTSGTYTFTNVTTTHTISATFVQNTYTVTATSGAHGSVTPTGVSTYNCGSNHTYTIAPAACYSVADVLVDGTSVGAVGTYTFTNVTANHTISATFVLTTYTVTATSGGNGNVTPAGVSTVNCGSNITYTITAASCYNIADVLVDGTSVGAVGTYTFTNVTANHTISATFSLKTYTITATSGANGTVTPAGVSTVNCGSNNTYTITPATCYAIANVLVDGVSVGAVGTYTFTNVTANHTISATFVLTTYTITATSGANGSVTPAGVSTVNCGSNNTYTITPDACYAIADVLVDGVSVGAVGTYTFTNVTANHTISATFVLTTYTINASAGGGGTITPSGAATVNCGDNATYTIAANACFSIANVVVDGISQGAITTYTFTGVTANHTISATFTLNTYTITATSGANGSVTPAGVSTVNCGSNNTYTITPDACYAIADVLVDGVSVGAVGTYTFTNVTANHTISATFVLTTYTITATSGANGTVTPAGVSTVNCGSNNTYTITPDACYAIADVLVDGVSVGAVGTYTFTNVTANHTISATFVLTTYTITATSGANGSVTPAGVSTVNCGSNNTYTITPDACYAIADVLVDGVSVGAVGTYTFTNVTANHTISATFVLTTYTITATSGANGTVTPAGVSTVNCGSNNTYTITPAACYAIADVLVDGVSVGAVATYTFTNVTANHTISATFVVTTYTITATSGANGTVTPAGVSTVNCGSNNTYTITPDACYAIADVLVDGVSVGAVGTYTFTNVTANHTISATFVLTTYTITATSGANGSVTPAGVSTVNCGSNNTYTITPDACYAIADVLVDGVSVGAVGTYTFNNTTANHTISATFVQTTYTITATSGANGSVTPAGVSTVNCGSNNTYTITPDACYAIADVLVDGVSVGAVGTYTFTNVTVNHTISATFVQTTYTITATSGANGSVTPAGVSTVNCGSNNTYTITPDACYAIADVLVDGLSVGAVGTYTFNNTTANHTISATFVQTTYTITATSGANGTVTPAGVSTVNCGSNNTYTITPDACYAIADVLVDGVSVGAVGTYTFNNTTANHTISATFVLTTYTISATSGANGSVTPAGVSTVNCGSNNTYTITPDACYAIADVLVDGVSVGAVGTYTFTNTTANHTISATFSLNTYTITATSGANGSVTPAGVSTVNCGSNNTYTITPDACYAIADVLVDGVSVGAVGTYTFNNTTANHTISATFVQTTYTITATSGANGSVTPAGVSTVNCGSNNTYTITPAACYAIADVLVDGVSVGAIGTYTFNNTTANHSISATFVLTTYTITATSGANGSVTPAGVSTVNCGSNNTYTIMPAACYAIADVLVDGVSVGAVGTYTFTNTTANHTISATFSLNTYTITATSGANGSVTPAGVSTVNCGANATYTITANAGYAIQNVIVDGVSQGATGTYTFTNVTANHTISATFVAVGGGFTITSSAGANGTISPNGVTSVPSGGSQSYTMTPAACYHVADVLVDGTSVGAVTTYTFTNVMANHTISVSFAINATLATPVVSGPQNICNYIGTGTPVTYTATSAGATGFTWIAPPNVTIVSGQGTGSIMVQFLGTFSTTQPNKQIRVTATSPCGNSAQAIYYLIAQPPVTPSPITGNTNVCPIIGTANTYTYTIPAVPDATSYVWTGQMGTTTITNNGTSATVQFSNGFTTSNITVQAVNGCGTSGSRSITVVRANPGTPGLISGPTNACPYMLPNGTAATYSVAAMADVNSYNWTVPAGATINGGQGTTSITVTYPSTFTSGAITVSATNGCGTGTARSLSISKLTPGTPGNIDVIQTAPCPNRVFTYTIAATPSNSTSVQWTVPAGGTITSGQGSNSITVSYVSTAINGNVTAQALSNCGSSSIRSVAVKLATCAGERNDFVQTKGRTIPAAESMEVKVFPNPSVADFNLQVLTAGKEAVNVRILDAQGREYRHFTVQPYQATTIGSDLKAGAYIMEVRQGSVVKTSKLIKF